MPLQQLLKTFPHKPTPQQKEAFQLLIQFLESESRREVFVLKGYAGTGKTSMMGSFIKLLRQIKYPIVTLAPTGRAAKVFEHYTQHPTSTIHRFIYETETSADGEMKFNLRENEDVVPTFYIVDEASMLSNKLEGADFFSKSSTLADLLKYVFGDSPYHKLLLIGDPAQLPPVGSSESPALNPAVLRREFELEVTEIELKEVVRQSLESGILLNANSIRTHLEPENLNNKPILNRHKDIILLENSQEALDAFTLYFKPKEQDNVMIITYSNYLATKINQAIRQGIHYQLEDFNLQAGDRVMIVKNHYMSNNPEMSFIANGEMATVRSVSDIDKKLGMLWTDVELEFADSRNKPILFTTKVVLDLLYSKEPNLSREKTMHIWTERKKSLLGKKKYISKQELRKDPYINALQIKFAYAITAHKAQGGQWNNVIILFENYLQTNNQVNTIDFLRWTYTAFTRATEKLYLLDCPFEVK